MCVYLALIVRPFARGFAVVFTGRVTLLGFWALGPGLDPVGGGGGAGLMVIPGHLEVYTRSWLGRVARDNVPARNGSKEGERCATDSQHASSERR